MRLIAWTLTSVIVIIPRTFKALDPFGKQFFQFVEIVYPVAAQGSRVADKLSPNGAANTIPLFNVKNGGCS